MLLTQFELFYFWGFSSTIQLDSHHHPLNLIFLLLLSDVYEQKKMTSMLVHCRWSSQIYANRFLVLVYDFSAFGETTSIVLFIGAEDTSNTTTRRG